MSNAKKNTNLIYLIIIPFSNPLKLTASFPYDISQRVTQLMKIKQKLKETVTLKNKFFPQKKISASFKYS